MSEEWSEVAVTKLDCARSQFETAILLWFEERDPISINTLTAAAHHVCNDLTGKSVGWCLSESAVPSGEWAKWRQFMCHLENFSKHADPDKGECDPRIITTYKAEMIDIYLADGLQIFHRLAPWTLLMEIYWSRFALEYPDFVMPGTGGKFEDALVIEIREASRPEFLKHALKCHIQLDAMLPGRPMFPQIRRSIETPTE